METRTIVMKVQYGEVLRCLSANVADLSMGVLIEKISTLFMFGPDTEIMLSFTDEDGDSVVLVDDEDLGEMVKQQQSPLRINVKSNGKARFFLTPNPGSFVETCNYSSGTTYEPHILSMDDYETDRMPGGDHKVLKFHPKLDNYFIRCGVGQYNIAVPPCSPFTKIWTMRNTGTVSWPHKTRLVWIEGYKLSNLLSVELEIPATGVPVGQEFDVSVDFISPELTGPYVSYWRMISPSGEKFGERLWVLMQVTHPVKTLFGGDPRREQENAELLLQTAAQISMIRKRNRYRTMDA